MPQIQRKISVRLKTATVNDLCNLSNAAAHQVAYSRLCKALWLQTCTPVDFLPIKIQNRAEAWPGVRPTGVVSRSRDRVRDLIAEDVWIRLWTCATHQQKKNTAAACNVRSFWLMPLARSLDSTMSRTTSKSHGTQCPGRRGRVARNNATECTQNKMPFAWRDLTFRINICTRPARWSNSGTHTHTQPGSLISQQQWQTCWTTLCCFERSSLLETLYSNSDYGSFEPMNILLGIKYLTF